jgi:glycosyltransferase involved in cell wall biosynthesis
MFFNRDRILMVVHAYYIEDTRVRREAEALTSAGKTVDVICLNKGDEPKKQTFKGVNIHRLGVSRSKVRTKVSYILEYLKFALFAMFKAAGLFFAIRPKVMVVHNMPNFLVFSGLIPRIFGAKVILDMHDVMPELYCNLFNIKGGALEKLLYLEEKLSGLFASRMMTVNDVMCDIIKSRVKKEMFILQNTPDPKCLVLSDDWPKTTDKFNLFHHGNIHERYGLGRILPIVQELNQDGEEYHLEVHGRGTFYETVEQKVAEMGIGSYCQLNGGFEPENVGNMLQNADVGLVLNFADKFADIILPVKLLEYVACKVPVISPRIKAVEAVFDEDMIFYFDGDEDLKRKIIEVKNNPELAKQKAERAYERYVSIQWENEKRRYIEFINQF